MIWHVLGLLFIAFLGVCAFVPLGLLVWVLWDERVPQETPRAEGHGFYAFTEPAGGTAPPEDTP